MAAKSITVGASADDVLASLDAYASRWGVRAERVPLQNGVRVKMGATSLNVYPSKDGGCKVVFDRPETAQADELAALLGGRASVVKPAKVASSTIEPVLPDVGCWIGSDESGKGDYFGPLVVAAVAVTSDGWRVLEALGMRDSKALSDRQATAMAAAVRDAFPNEVVVIMPPRYNELWAKMRSVNKVLAWAHARAIEQVAGRSPSATAAVADQFGDESLIREALFKRGRELQLVQMHRAERDPAVAAASVLARAEFVRRLGALAKRAGMPLPKGASPAVDAAARALVAARGAGAIDEYAKRHFKTTQRALRP